MASTHPYRMGHICLVAISASALSPGQWPSWCACQGGGRWGRQRAPRRRPVGACGARCNGSMTDTGAAPVDKGCGGRGCRWLAASADSESRQKLCWWREGWLGGRLASAAS